jgi:rhodanese-related sulfurtransferase
LKDDFCYYKEVTPQEVAELPADTGVLLLDVRTPREYRCHRIPGVVLIPVQELSSRYQELDPERPTICICEHGIRSETAAEFLAHHDFADVATMRGGMVQWPGPLEKG